MYPIGDDTSLDTGGLPILPPKKGKQQPLDTGGLPILKKKENLVSQNGGQVGTSVPQSDVEDPVKTMLQPHREQYQLTSGSLYNQPQSGEQQGLRAPIPTTINESKELQHPVADIRQQNDIAAKKLVEADAIVKQHFFQNGQEAKKYLQEAADKGKINPNNETQQLAKERSDTYDKIKNDVYGTDGTGSIAAAALKEKMESDPNFKHKFINSYKEGIGLDNAEEGAIISKYMAKHQNDLEELSKDNPDIKEDYDDTKKNILTKFPDFGKSLLAQKISDEREKRNYNSSAGNFNSATFHKHNEDIAKTFSPEELKFFNENKADIESQIKRGGYLNNLGTSLVGAAHGTKDFLNRLVGGEPSKGESAYKDLQAEGSSVIDPSKGWKQMWGTLGDVSGKLLYMTLVNKGLGAAGVAPNVASKLSVPATFGEDIMKQQEAEFPEDNAKAKLSGLMKLGLITFLNPFHAERASKAIDDIISKAGDNESILSLRNKMIKAITSGGEEVAKATGQNVTYTGAAQLVDKVMGLDNGTFKKFHPESEMYESAKAGATMGLIPGVLTGVSKAVGTVKPNSQNIIPEENFQTMDMGNDEGKTETKEAREKMKERFSDGDVPVDGKDGKGETGKQFASRVLSQWENTKQNEDANTTIVTHSSVLKAIKAYEGMKDKPEDPNNFSPEQWKEFSDNYNKEGTENGDLETFKGNNGDIHVIRHGQTEDNEQNKFRSGNTPLTEKGVNQAEEAGKQLKEKTNGEVPKIISSDLPRTIHSSNIINDQLATTPKETVNETKPIEEVPPPPTKEEVPVSGEGEGNKVGASHASLTDLANKLGLKEPERGQYVDPETYAERGRQLLKAGAAPNEVNNPNNELHDRIAISRAHLENLVKEADTVGKEKGTDNKEYQEAHQKVNDYANDVVKKLGTSAHKAMVSLQGERDIDTDSFTTVKRELQDRTGKAPSPKQEAKIKELTDTNNQLKQRAEEAEAKLIIETQKAFEAGKEEGKKTTRAEKAKNVADRLRASAKLHKPGSFSAATPASLVWDSAVEIVAKGIEAGGKLADVIDDGLKHIRNSDWYKSLNDDKKQAAEKDFKDFSFDNTKSESLEDLQARFVDKKGNKFTTNEAKDIWDYAKKTYLDNGVSFREMIQKVKSDLGLTWKQVSSAITTPKTERISNEMWKKQSDYRRNQNATKNWIESQTDNKAYAAVKKVSGAFRGVSVFGHGGIFMGTHAGMTLFQPTTWNKTIPAFFRGWKYAYGNVGEYEKSMEQLKNDPNYVLAQRSGLKNNPERFNAEEFQKSQKYLGKLGLAGERGFNAVKVLRQDLFNYHFNKLTETEKADPEVAKSIAKLVNNATGATNLNLPEWVNEVSFAGGMEAARWGKLTRNPAKATATAIKALLKPESASTADRVFAKVWASRVGQQLGTLTGLLLANVALQNTLNPKNPVNYKDPTKGDFMKFKFGDITIDPTSGMRGALMFAYGLGKVPFETKKQRKGDTPVQAAGKSSLGYLRGKAAPLYSTIFDFFDKQDFNRNPMPFSNEKPGAGHHKLTWGEYAWEKAPLPIAHAAEDMYHSALDNGADKITLNHVLDGIISGAISGGTGFRVGEYNAEQKNHSPFTEEDKKDPTLKYFLDKGLELPNTVNSSEKITNPKDKTVKLISEFPEAKQKEYVTAHKDLLKQELGDYRKRGYVYTEEFTMSNGEKDYRVYKDKKKGAEKTKIDDLNKEQLSAILSDAQSNATKKAKEKVFYKK